MTTYTSHMTKEQLAASLDGCQYRDEVSGGFEKAAKDAGLIVIFGASDDLMEFRGAVHDEIGAYDGVIALLYKDNFRFHAVPNNSEAVREIEDDFRLHMALGAYMERRNIVEAVWGPKDVDAAWLIKTDLPHATFDVMEEDELYCRGLVIDTRDLA